ncbi:MAG: hypothetical protein AAGC57_20720 [Pseudomonadota bacterium]
MPSSMMVDPANVLGHREVKTLIVYDRVPAKFRTNKTCPGTLIEMGAIRSAVRTKLAADASTQPAGLEARLAAIETELVALRAEVQSLKVRAEQ